MSDQVLWSARQSATEYLGGRIEAELLKDLALACCESRWLHFTPQPCSMNDERVAVEGSQNRLRRGAFFFDRRVAGDLLAVNPLDEEVERQSHHQQEH